MCNGFKLYLFYSCMVIFFNLGSTNGLFCYTTNQPNKSLSKINGIKSVSLIRIALHVDRMIVLFSCGELVHCSLRQFNAVVKSVALSSIQPSTLPDFKNIDTTDIDDATKEGSNCNMFEVSIIESLYIIESMNNVLLMIYY